MARAKTKTGSNLSTTTTTTAKVTTSTLSKAINNPKILTLPSSSKIDQQQQQQQHHHHHQQLNRQLQRQHHPSSHQAQQLTLPSPSSQQHRTLQHQQGHPVAIAPSQSQDHYSRGPLYDSPTSLNNASSQTKSLYERPFVLPSNSQEALNYYPGPPPQYTPSTHSTSYPSSESSIMAATHMRPSMPPLYHTPQSNSPASVHSPQDHGRPIYGQAPSTGIFFPQYSMQSSNPYYQQHQNAPHHPSLASQPLRMPYGQPHQIHQSPVQPHTPSMDSSSPRSAVDQSMSRRPISQMGPPHIASTRPPGTPQSLYGSTQNGSVAGQNSAPGPIPATTPLLVKQDDKGVQWIQFEYSRDRIKMQHEIRCDVESVEISKLSQEFKQNNCVYPRACSTKEPYKGNRLGYETECNEVGWALANLNPPLQGKRGLIQRAVDSWRNSNADQKFRSRRVRRLAKSNKRNQAQQANQMQQASSSAKPGHMPAPQRASSMSSLDSSALHHHHMHSDRSPPIAGGDVGLHNNYLPKHQDVKSPATNDIRPIHNFYPSYHLQSTPGATDPPMRNSLDHMSSQSAPTSSTISTILPRAPYDFKESTVLSELPSSLPPKMSIAVKDWEREKNPRITFKLDGLNMNEIEPSWRRKSAVYPRSYVARQIDSPSNGSHHVFANPADDYDEVATEGTIVKTVAPVKLQDGHETEASFPRMTLSRRNKERALNDIGSRIAFDKPQMFVNRTLLLQRTLDDCRTHIRKAIGKTSDAIPPYLEARVGKRKWTEHTDAGTTTSDDTTRARKRSTS